MLLAMYEAITLGYCDPRRQLDVEVVYQKFYGNFNFGLFLLIQVLDLFNQFCQNMKAFSSPMKQMARLLLTNKQGGPLAQMTMTQTLPAEFKTLGSVVVHTVAVLSSNSAYPILLPFVNMMTNPAVLSVSSLWILQ